MNIYLHRALTAGVAALSLALMLPLGASANTGPWQWSDLSDKLTTRDNRPVWAIARAEPYWYLTDGQDLWSGGHIWKTDGAIVSDITLEARSAGVSRADDIVSDGQTVIYLKNVVKADRSFEAIAYNGTYSYPASTWQNWLNSNEGIASINGKNGVWMIVTTQGRIFRWNQSTNIVTQVTPPGSYTLGYSTLLYSTRHSSPADDRQSFLVAQTIPTSNGWIFLVPQVYNSYPYTATNWRVYQYTSDGIFNDLTGNFSNLQYINTVASNGSQVLIVGGDQMTNYNRAYLVENTYVKTLYNLPAIAWYKALVGYNGKSWIIISGKDLVRFDGTNFQSYGQTRDYFIQTIGNGRGTFLLGGAVSSDGLNGPTYPLTAKLVRADEGVVYVDNTTYTSNLTYTAPSNESLATANGYQNRITYWAWFNPGYRYHANNTKPIYTAGTQSNDGIKRIDLYVNDVYQKTCWPGNTKKNTQCSVSVNPAAWPLDSNVGAFAKITSGKNRVAYVPASIIRFYNAGGTTYTTNSSLSANMNVSNNTPYLQRGTTSNVYVTGVAGEGINRIEIYVNGLVKQTCSMGSTTGSCSLALNGNDYNLNTAVSFNGRVVSQNGRETWTWLGRYMVTDYNSNYGYNYNYNYNAPTTNSNTLSATVWFDPSTNDFATNNTKYIMAQANAPVGLKNIEIVINGSVKQSCGFANAYGTQSCQVTAYGSNYSGQFNIPVYVRATDANSQQATSQTLYLNPSNAYSYNNNNNYNSNATVTVSTDRTSYGRNESFYVYATASDADGLQRLDLYANGTYVNACSLNNAAYGSCATNILGYNYTSGSLSLPLQAKATDRYGNVTWSDTKYVQITGDNNNNNYDTTVTLALAPNKTSFARAESFTVTANATDGNGIQKIELYANGSLWQTCNAGYGTTANCSANLIGTGFPSNLTSLPLQAKVTDNNSNAVWSSTTYVQLTDTYNPPSQNDTHGTIDISSDADSGYTGGQQITFTANGSDANGIKRLEIYVGSDLVKTCYGSAPCSYTGGPFSAYQLIYGAKLIDNLDNTVWSGYKYIYKK